MEELPPQVRQTYLTAAATAARGHETGACRTISSSSVSAQPGLATVPEGRAMNASLSAGLPAMHYTAEPLVPTEDLSNMSVEELQAELIRTRQAFHSAGAPLITCTSCCCNNHASLCIYTLQHLLPCILVHVQSLWYPAVTRKKKTPSAALLVCACLT